MVWRCTVASSRGAAAERGDGGEGRGEGEWKSVDSGDAWRDAALVSRDRSVVRRDTRRVRGDSFEGSARTVSPLAERLGEPGEGLAVLGYATELRPDPPMASRCTADSSSDCAEVRVDRAPATQTRAPVSAKRSEVPRCSADVPSAAVVVRGDRPDVWTVSGDGLAYREKEPAAGARVRSDGREKSPDGVVVSKRDVPTGDVRIEGRCCRFVETSPLS